MGEMLLCSHELAFVPYYIDSIALNVYSLEELCYYLIDNTDLVEPSFMDTDLIDWIRGELKLPQLADQLEEQKAAEGSLLEIVLVLLSGCNYCTKEEVNRIREILTDFEHKSEAECKKIRADRLLQKKRYHAAILEYKRLLAYPEVTGILAGNICHNMGSAYARLFSFREAADCYEEAYKMNQNPLSLQQKKIALQLEKGAVPRNKAEDTEFLTVQEQLTEWKEGYIKNCR